MWPRFQLVCDITSLVFDATENLCVLLLLYNDFEANEEQVTLQCCMVLKNNSV